MNNTNYTTFNIPLSTILAWDVLEEVAYHRQR